MLSHALRAAHTNPNPPLPGTQPVAPRTSLLGRLGAAVARATQPLEFQTTVHPCYIDGTRTLVHQRGLASEAPTVWQKLKAYALLHGFALLEDRRKRELACRDERRRLAPVLMFAASALATQVTVAADGSLEADGETVVPTIEIIGKRSDVSDDREYLVEAGKRFVSRPHGETELILAVAGQVRLHGDYHRVRTRGLQMPPEYTESFVDRYDYVMPQSCGGRRFSYYEGEGFAALGYHGKRGKVILDVLAGGGPFSAPRLWGAYDQVLNSSIRMDLMFGNGLKDGMGVLQASYKIGLMPVMEDESMDYYGGLYSRAVAQAASCEDGPSLPATVRQADVIEAKAVDDRS